MKYSSGDMLCHSHSDSKGVVLVVGLLPWWWYVHSDEWVLSTVGLWGVPPVAVTVRCLGEGVPPIVLPTSL